MTSLVKEIVEARRNGEQKNYQFALLQLRFSPEEVREKVQQQILDDPELAEDLGIIPMEVTDGITNPNEQEVK